MKINKFSGLNLCYCCQEFVSGGEIITIEEKEELFQVLICYGCLAQEDD